MSNLLKEEEVSNTSENPKTRVYIKMERKKEDDSSSKKYPCNKKLFIPLYCLNIIHQGYFFYKLIEVELH